MRVLRFIWRGVLAFDRIGSRIPQLIQIWLGELLFVISLSFFIAKIIDIRGAFGVPGTGGSLPAVFWGAFALSLVCGFFFVRNLVRPRVVEGKWTPMIRGDVGDYTVMVGNPQWTVHYVYLTSHPSYALLLLLTAPIPAVIVAATVNHGDSTFYFRVAGIVGLIILALMALARVLAWYVFRFGRRQLDSQIADQQMSPRRLGWEIAWKPVLMVIVLMYAIVCIPIGWMWFQEKRTIAALPVVTVDDTERAGQYRRIEGESASEAVYWAPRGTGRGGNNYAGAGVLVQLPSGGEALLLAESLSVPDFVGAMHDVKNGELKTTGKVIDTITDTQVEYYGFNQSDFPEPSSDGRVMLLMSYP
jgi:hypothetical protein